MCAYIYESLLTRFLRMCLYVRMLFVFFKKRDRKKKAKTERIIFDELQKV